MGRRRVRSGEPAGQIPPGPVVVYGVTAGVSAYNLLRGQLAFMHDQGVDVLLVAAPGEHLIATGRREGVRTFAVDMSREIDVLRDIRALVAWTLLLWRERPDVINVGTPKAALLGAAAAFATRVPRRVYVVRGLRYEGASGRTRRVLMAMEWATVAMSTDVVVVSRSVGAAMLRDRLLGRRMPVLLGAGSSNGVDGPAVREVAARSNRAELLKRMGWEPGTEVVAFVGRLTRDKGAETLIAAMQAVHRRHPTAALLCIGDLEEPDLRATLEQSGVPVHLTGWTDVPWAYFSAIDVLALPSRREGFPNVVLEAASVGVPTVTTRATGAADAVVDEVTGLVVGVDDAAEFSGALHRLLIDRALRERMGVAARSRAETDFAPEVVWNGLLDLYREPR